MSRIEALWAGWFGVGVPRQRLANRSIWFVTYGVVVGAGLFVALVAYRRSYQPYFGVALAAVLLVVCGWMFRPRATLTATVFLALVGDIATVGWFPFNKNLSSRESILFVSDSISLSPLELVLFSGVAIVGLRRLADGLPPVALGSVGRIMAVFTAFVLLGLANGLLTGGDFRAAMFEMRPLLYAPLVYVLTTALCTTARHQRALIAAVVAAVFVQSLLSLEFWSRLTAEERDELESLTEHGSAIGMNLVFALLLLSLTFSRIRARQRILLFLASIPIMWVYLITQRRAAVVAFGVAMILIAIALFWKQRSTFWKAVPLLTIVIVGYLGAFWTSESALSFPAQAVRSVVAPDDGSARDRSSDRYRILENLDVHATIRAAPVTGLGFGQKFYRPYPLPDISRFEFNQYLPHNSFLWLWIKTGFFGFATMVYLLGRSILLGTQRFRSFPSGPDAVVCLASVAFIAMYTIYTYVDVAWGSRNMVLLGATIAIATSTIGPASKPSSTSGRTVTSSRPEMRPETAGAPSPT